MNRRLADLKLKLIMPLKIYRNLKFVRIAACVLFLTSCQAAQAETNWASVTIDNDLLVDSDNGYTNGMFYSWFDTPENIRPEPGFLARSMLWSFSSDIPIVLEASVKTVGQTMITPDDISLENPPLPPDDLPYAGLLFYSDTYIKSYQKRAEKISVTIGIIGKYSIAEESQKLVHGITGSDQPKGWNTQLDDEIVFQFMHERVWKSWTSDSGRTDILLGTGVMLGTLSSSLGAAVMLRYGSQLKRTFSTALLVSSKAANPVATDPVSTDSGWYLFAGANTRYVLNQIFLDGNTFDNDKSIDYNRDQFGVTLGMAYSWRDLSFTFALYDVNVNESEEYTEYGTFTLAWRHS